MPGDNVVAYNGKEGICGARDAMAAPPNRRLLRLGGRQPLERDLWQFGWTW